MHYYDNIQTFGLDVKEKNYFLLDALNSLTKYHVENCKEYKSLTQKLKTINFSANEIKEIPYIPVRLFKHLELLSVPKKNIIKTMVSSGTTGNEVSKIFLDKDTSYLQRKILSKIVSDFIGSKRLPMLIIDIKSLLSKNDKFSARAAGVLGFSIFGNDIEYALDDDMNINLIRIQKFLNKHKGKRILIFGFTFIIWKHFIDKLKKLNVKLDIPNGILVHGGGWKNLNLESINNEDYKKEILKTIGISKVHNYYGMVEQTGSIYMECDYNYLHTSSFSDIVIRDFKKFEKCSNGESGLIQLLSVIPKSYPGHSLLTEDIGVIYGTDDCKCGRKGKYFKVFGRIADSESRGCSDTYTG